MHRTCRLRWCHHSLRYKVENSYSISSDDLLQRESLRVRVPDWRERRVRHPHLRAHQQLGESWSSPFSRPSLRLFCAHHCAYFCAHHCASIDRTAAEHHVASDFIRNQLTSSVLQTPLIQTYLQNSSRWLTPSPLTNTDDGMLS